MLKKVLKLLALQLLFLLFFIIKLITPANSYASELIGTHLGEGDVSYQANIINTVLIPNGLEPGSPVTVMVPSTMLLDPNQNGTVQTLASAVNNGGFFPIVRINDVCNSQAASNSVNAVNTARQIFGNNAIIVWGNEVNNQEKECSNWQYYYDGFSTLKGISNVSPSALDYYMGNQAYTVSKMYADQPGMAELFNTSPRAANAYGCVGSTATECDPLSTTTQQIGYQEAGSPFYLTEFSLSPEGNSANAPDTNIQKVLDFIANRAAETGAQKITPLVRNVCNSESAWLLYINGKLFTPQGTEVGENCEGTFDNSGFNTSIYPNYDVDEKKYFVSPIRNLVNSPSTIYTVERLREELAKQGYESYCVSEDIAIKPEYNTEELISKFFQLNPNGIKELEVDAIESLDSNDANYPLWRDVSNKQFLMASLEEYFGFKDVYNQSPSGSVLTSGPINSLLSEPQMCVQGWRNLVAQELACERLQFVEECLLFTRPIPGTSYTVKSLLDDLKEYEPYYRDGLSEEGCTALVNGDKYDYPDLYEGLINTPTYFDRAYRYGFLVAVIHAENPTFASKIKELKIFNFLTASSFVEKPRDEVLVVAFKLPDIATNKFQDDVAGIQFWDDPLSLIRLLLSTKEKNDLHEANDDTTDPKRLVLGRNEKANELLTRAIEKQVQGPDDRIYCTEWQGGRAIKGTTSCRYKITKALTDLINGNAEGCGENETVNIIKDWAGFGNPDEPNFDIRVNRIFNNDNGGEVLLNLFKSDKTHPEAGNRVQRDPQIAKTETPAEQFKSYFNLTKPNWDTRDDTGTTADFYLVYPMGYELKSVEDAIIGSFFSKAQIAALDKKQTVDGFEMTGQRVGLGASTTGFEFEDKDKTDRGECGSSINPRTGLPINVPCMENVEITVKQDPAGIGVLGGRLGFYMREVQKQLTSRVTDAWEYVNSCETTEEFMLGNCKGGSSNGGSNTGDELACSNLKQLTVNLPTMSQLEDLTCQVANNNENDAQLLWGLMQVDGSPFLRAIRNGQSSMSCGDIILNSCGASQITGVLIPQCIDVDACPQAANIADPNTTDPFVIEARENPNVACDIQTQLEYSLRKRKSEVTYLREEYFKANNTEPTIKQLYYMMAARQYGLPISKFTQNACGDADPVSGCSNENYCVCVMDVYKFRGCGG